MGSPPIREEGLSQYGAIRQQSLQPSLARSSNRRMSWITRLPAHDRFGATHTNFDFDPRTEPVDDRHKTIDCKPPEVGITDAREICRGNAGAAVGGAHGQEFPVERLDDFGGQI